MLAHLVYFTLNDNSQTKCQELVDACKEFLSGHPGTIFFAAGTCASDYDRPVNDRDFDVALHVVFESRQTHDNYQVADRHLAFIAANKENWKQVRVFDADVASA